MAEITVWTKQNSAVLEQLADRGRFIADEQYIRKELEDTADIMLFAYRWLADHAPTSSDRPDDVLFPVWVSFSRETTMIPEPGYTILELSIEESLIAYINVEKWTLITNYQYLPESEEDAGEHARYMRGIGINDAKAVMTQFYPEERRKIISSWDKLFDNEGSADAGHKYGIIWEVRKEWVRNVI